MKIEDSNNLFGGVISESIRVIEKTSIPSTCDKNFCVVNGKAVSELIYSIKIFVLETPDNVKADKRTGNKVSVIDDVVGVECVWTIIPIEYGTGSITWGVKSKTIIICKNN